MEQTLLRPVPVRRPLTRRERRRLADRDRVSARLAELETIKDLLTRAAARVHTGWCQDTWAAPALAGRPGVCLVSAIRVSGPDPTAQAANRAVDVAWHALHDDAGGIRWVPAPSTRLARVRDLARWNDRRGRTVDEVSGLLTRSVGYADREMVRLRAAL